MTRPVVIDVAGISLAYRLYKKPSDMLWEGLFGSVRHDTFWALKHIDFKVHEGQRLGIIGPNGAGKSSLLQIIAGNIAPTSGKVKVNGKISSLLSLSPVWNGEDTGIENVKFNLMVQGAKARDIPRLTEDIVDFTELGAFMHQPVRTYSSGMSARLAFAIATAIQPEILIIDEVLGAGDGYFANKATRRMKDMCDRGKALIFVSHSLASVRQLCNTCLWLENGAVQDQGDAEMVLRRYDEDILRQDEDTLREGNRARMRALKGMAAPEDMAGEDLLHIRIRGEQNVSVTDTHYIRSISLDVAGHEVQLPVELSDISKQDAALDLFSCQWGRMFERGKEVCRTLQPRAGSKKGGHILIRPPAGLRTVPVKLTFESASLTGEEELSVESLDIGGGVWKPMRVERTPLAGGWTRTVAAGEIEAPDHTALAAARTAAELTFRPPVEIKKVEIISFGHSVVTIDESQPFTVRVTAEHHERVPGVSINLNIVRSDGVYVFYQPSGIDDDNRDTNIKDHLGRSVVEFHFDPNPFGFGEYELNVFATNNFTWDNIPPSEIYDKSIGATKFRINMKRPIVFGLMNLTAAVDTRLEGPAQETKPPQAAE